MAGYDSKGPHLCEVTATGFTTYSPFMSMGSGSLNAYSLLESRYRDNMTLEEATQLAIDGIKAGIIYDNGSGSNVDIVRITEKGNEYKRNVEIVGKKIDLMGNYEVIPNNIQKLKSTTIKLKGKEEEEDNRIQEESVSRQSGGGLDIEN